MTGQGDEDQQDSAAPEQDRTPQEPALPPHKDEETPGIDPDGSSGDEAKTLHAQASIYVYGDVYADGSNWGVAGGSATGFRGVRSLTGTINSEHITQVRQGYAAPRAHKDALDLLNQHRYVILSGPEDSGKTAGAVNLLTDDGSNNKVVGLSPLLSWADLVSYSFRSDTSYVVLNHRLGNYHPREPEHELRALSGKLRDHPGRPRVVFTTTSEAVCRWATASSVEWSAPESGDLVRAHVDRLRLQLTEEQVGRVVDFADACKSPRLVVRLLSAVADAPHEFERLMESAESAANGPVGRWLDAQPRRSDIAILTGMVFLAGSPLPTVERHVDRLRQHLDHKVNAKRRPEKSPKLTQARLAFREIPFIEVALGVTPSSAVRQQLAVFQHPLYRQQAVAELWRRYSEILWGSVRGWIIETVHNCDLTLAEDTELILRITDGVALLAQWSLEEVVNHYIERWADGNLSEKITAAVTIGALEAVDPLVGTGLEIAESWIAEDDPNHSLVGVLAFSGKLGTRYPGQALNRIWAYGAKNTKRAALAESAIAGLFAINVALTGEPVKVVKFAIQLIERVRGFSPGPVARRVGITVASDEEPDMSNRVIAQTRAYRLGLEVLRARVQPSGHTSCAELLHRDPSVFPDLAKLCRHLLQNTRYRRDTIDAIRGVLDDSSARFPGSELPSDFAKHLATGLTEEQIRRLRRDFETVFSKPPLRGKDYKRFTSWFKDPPTPGDEV